MDRRRHGQLVQSLAHNIAPEGLPSVWMGALCLTFIKQKFEQLGHSLTTEGAVYRYANEVDFARRYAVLRMSTPEEWRHHVARG